MPGGPTTATPVEVSNWGSKGVMENTSFPVKDYRGPDGDGYTLPTDGITPGSTYLGWETGTLYIFDGTEWKAV